MGCVTALDGRRLPSGLRRRPGRGAPRRPERSVGCSGAEVVRRRSAVRRHLGPGGAHGPGPARMAAHPPRLRGSARPRSLTGAVPSVAALDLFGFGATPPPPEAWGSPEYAAAPAAALRGAGGPGRTRRAGRPLVRRPRRRPPGHAGPRPHRAAWCSPGYPCSTARAAAPARSPPTGWPGASTGWGWWGRRAMEALRNKYGSPDYRAAQGVMRGVFVRMLDEQYEDQMAAIDCPVDLLWGEADTDVPLEVAERAQGIFPSARLQTLPGIGHLTPTEAPAQLRAVVLGQDPARARAVSAAPPRHHPGRAGSGPAAPRGGLDHRGRLRGGLCPGRPPVAAGGPAGALPGRVGVAVRTPVVAGRSPQRGAGRGRAGRRAGFAVVAAHRRGRGPGRSPPARSGSRCGDGPRPWPGPAA